MSQYTIADIARICNTSRATVSRVLNNPSLVAHPLRERIQRTMAELGYKPNPFASRLGSKNGWGLALFVFDILNPFFARLVRRIGHLAMEQGIPLTVCDTENNPEKERLYLDHLMSNRIGGVIFTEGMSTESVDRASRNAPVVLIDRRHRDGHGAEVSSDNYDGARQATEYLLRLQHRRIAFVSGPLGWSSAEARYQGFCDTLHANGIDQDPTLVYRGDLRFESGVSALEYFLTLPQWPTAIFTANDQMAAGVHSKASALNIAIPGDISLVGFDDIPFYGLHDVQLTTVRQDIDQLCEHAFEIMLAKLRGEASNGEPVVVPTGLRVGDTCKKLEREEAGALRSAP
jgi:DNA-binding LacI/PurR family transcriptional regulator